MPQRKSPLPKQRDMVKIKLGGSLMQLTQLCCKRGGVGGAGVDSILQSSRPHVPSRGQPREAKEAMEVLEIVIVCSVLKFMSS